MFSITPPTTGSQRFIGRALYIGDGGRGQCEFGVRRSAFAVLGSGVLGFSGSGVLGFWFLGSGSSGPVLGFLSAPTRSAKALAERRLPQPLLGGAIQRGGGRAKLRIRSPPRRPRSPPPEATVTNSSPFAMYTAGDE